MYSANNETFLVRHLNIKVLQFRGAVFVHAKDLDGFRSAWNGSKLHILIVDADFGVIRNNDKTVFEQPDNFEKHANLHSIIAEPLPEFLISDMGAWFFCRQVIELIQMLVVDAAPIIVIESGGLQLHQLLANPFLDEFGVLAEVLLLDTF